MSVETTDLALSGGDAQPQRRQLNVRGLPVVGFDDLWRLATAAVKGGIAPKDVRSTEDAFARMAMGMELGIPPMTALRGIANINGRPAVWGTVATGLVASSGELEYVKERYDGEGKDRVAICEVKRVSRPNPRTATFSYRDAERAGLLGKDTYRNYLDDMLMWRARSRAYGGEFPDVMQGMFFAEIARDIEPEGPKDERPRNEQVNEKIKGSPLLAGTAFAPSADPQVAQAEANSAAGEGAAAVAESRPETMWDQIPTANGPTVEVATETTAAAPANTPEVVAPAPGPAGGGSVAEPAGAAQDKFDQFKARVFAATADNGASTDQKLKAWNAVLLKYRCVGKERKIPEAKWAEIEADAKAKAGKPPFQPKAAADPDAAQGELLPNG